MRGQTGGASMIDGWAPVTPVWKKMPGDAWAVVLIVALTAVVTWHLFYFDAWLLQLDISNYFVPWYAHLGKRLSEGSIPGWNPHQSSGAPFAGDPQSGWMYFPAMLLFPFLAPVAAFKSLMGLELLISGVTTYVFARVMRLGVPASLAAAFVFEFSLFSNSPSYCCTNRIQVWTWIPMLLLGVELALRSRSWRTRMLPWCLSGVALSQIYAGWLGQGSYYALFLFGSFLAYRVLFADATARGPIKNRLIVGAATGIASGVISVGIGAAGLFPRFIVSTETLVGQGNYADLPNSVIRSPSLHLLVLNILGSENAPRGVAFGGLGLVLIWFAPFIARKAYGTTYFAVLTVCVYLLMLHDSPLHLIFYIVPNLPAIHEHNTINVSAIGAIGPAMLVGATVERLPSWRPRPTRTLLAALPLIGIFAGLLVLGRNGLRDAGIVQIAALATTALVIVAVLRSPRTARWVQITLVALAFLLPTGVQMGSAWIGQAAPSPWRALASFPPQKLSAIATLTADAAPGQAGGYLQDQRAINGPFRFSGFTANPNRNAPTNYMAYQDNPYVLAVLMNARAMALGLDDVSAYNPSQLARYALFINALNGNVQNYHKTYIMVHGFASELFPLLNVRYVLVDRRLKASSAEVKQITKGRHAVFHDARVTVYESNTPVSPAWIVHSVTSLPRNTVLAAMTAKGFDPHTSAIIEGVQVAATPPSSGAVENTRVTSYEPERVTIEANATSAGLLVVSEVYESGWKAYLDGKEVAIVPTDYAFRGVALTAGRHTIDFRYEPASLKWGIWVSALTGMIIAALAGWRLASRWQNRRRLSSR